MPRPTFSTCDLLVACPLSHRLPWADDDTDAMRRGSARHKFLEVLGRTGDRALALDSVPPEYHTECAALETDGVDLSGEHEVAVCVDLLAVCAERITLTGHRAYPEPPPGRLLVHGTIDLMRPSVDVVTIVDHKGPMPCTPNALASLQMRLSAAAGMLIFGVDSATVEHRHWRDDGSSWDDGPHVLGIYDVFPDVARVREAMRDTTSGPQPGRHCARCNAVISCPAASRETLDLVSADGAMSAAQIDLARLVARDPRGALEVVRRVEHALGVVKSQLAANAKETPIDLGDGRRWGWHSATRDVIDGGRAFEVLAQRFGPAAAVGAVEMKLTKKALAVLAKSQAPHGQGAALKREVEASLREHGIMLSKKVEACGEYRDEEDEDE